ncbi:MAG: polysaccharide biosynthesis protein [Deltaproteobacteria bacterium]|nr:polysaccharide biosynthesis protein [Deltaproteobacteria bacterium]
MMSQWEWSKKVIMKYRRLIVIVIHLTTIVFSYYCAFLLRYNGLLSEEETHLFEATLPWILLIRGATFIPFRLYEGLWRYTGIWDLRNIIGAVFLSSAFSAICFKFFLKTTDASTTLVIIDSVLLICLLGGMRLTRRIYRELGHPNYEKKVLIFGAGDAGEMIVRDIKNNNFYQYEPIGFIDDDPTKVGQSIHRIPVLGTRKNLAKIVAERSPDEILIAISKMSPSKIRELVKILEPYKIPIKTLPNLRDVLDGKISVGQIRNLSLEDLLDRAPVNLDSEPVRHLIEGKRVLVTGAGGSIGSELCRQIMTLKPRSLILVERHENSLYEIEQDLLRQAQLPPSRIHPLVADVTDHTLIHRLFEQLRPQIVFHAAAHKHVPLMESHPCEAVKNNVAGTRTVAEAAARHGAERFILISSDKAVNPSSVMGATKKIAELFIQQMDRRYPTVFASVRFGNVIGSNGSVIPRFIKQIEEGGPVTITHEEMRRYFMLIPEAVHLVLHATALAHKGDVFVLEMGEQIKVLELARNLIRLTGYLPDTEIPISFIGHRPGEKLYEELVGKDESIKPSGIENIMLVESSAPMNHHLLMNKIREFEEIAQAGDSETLLQLFADLIPTFKSEGLPDSSQASPAFENIDKFVVSK